MSSILLLVAAMAMSTPLTSAATAPAVGSTDAPTTTAGDPLDQPFRSPQYLLHATGHGTMSGPVDDDWWFLFPSPPDADGLALLPDGEGGTFTYSIDVSSGPYATPRPVCASMTGKLEPGAAMSEWGGPVTFVCVPVPPPPTTDESGTDGDGDGGDTTDVEFAPVCTVNGQVIDVEGVPVPDIHLRLEAGGLLLDTSTDASGFYRFAEIGDDPGGGVFDSRTDEVAVSLLTEEWAHDASRFRILDETDVGRLDADEFLIEDEPDCRRDFDLRALPARYEAQQPVIELWPDIVEIYQNIHRSWAFADLIGITLDYGLPLPVRAWCESEDFGCDEFDRGDGAFFSGSRSGAADVVEDPYIAFGTATSAYGSTDNPDNREYHEFGHYAMANLLGDALPLERSSTNHWGYWNPSSTDAWMEGFAEFYSLMVGKYIEGKPFDQLYRVDARGASSLRPGPFGTSVVDLSQDWQVWDSTLEEFAVASFLWQLQSATYATPAVERSPRVLALLGYTVVQDPNYGPLVIGTVENRTAAEPDAPWAGASFGTTALAVFLTEEGTTVDTLVGATIPADIGAGDRALVVLPVKPDLEYDDLVLTVHEGRPPAVTPPPPPLTITAADLIRLIASAPSSKPQANGRVWDIEDLRAALESVYGGQGTVVNGFDTIDQLLLRHGYHEDLDGSHDWSQGEEVGRSSHPVFGDPTMCSTTRADPRCGPARIPRTDVRLPDSMNVSVATDADDAVVYVQVRYPEASGDSGYGFAVAPDAAGQVVVPVPPPASDATVTLIAVADGRVPTVLGQLEAGEFWKEAAAHGDESFVSLAATLPKGDFEVPEPMPRADELVAKRPAVTATDSRWWEQPGWVGWLIVAGVVGGLVMVFRRSSSGAGPAGPPRS